MSNKNQRSRAYPLGEPDSFSKPRSPPQIEPMQPMVQPRGLLRSLATLGMPGVVILFFLGLVQLFAPYDWKPTVMVGKAIATYEVTVIRETLMDKAKAEEMIAEARSDGERQAEIDFQEKLKAIEFEYQEKLALATTQFQSGMAAYQSLYDRANLIQQSAMQMEGTLLQYKQQAISQTQGGKAFIANASDIGCIFSPALCKVGDEIRADMADELVDAARKGNGTIARDFLSDMPNAAELQSQIMLPDRIAAQ